VVRTLRIRLLVAALLTASACLAPAASAAIAEDAVSVRPALPMRPPLEGEHLWEGGGVVVGDATAFPAERARVLRRNRFRWVAVKIHHGLGRVRATEAALRTDWARVFRREGIRVCGWGVVEQHPIREAQLVAALVRRLGLECYIADAEAPYLGEGYGGAVARSATFVRTFRVRAGSLPAAVTTYGAALRPWILPFDYAAWRRHGFHLLPQSYLSIAEHYGPASSTIHAVRAGFPREWIHPMIGIGWAQGRRKHWGGDYVWRLIEAKTQGFSVFLGETTSDTDFDVLGRGVARFGIAR
jgi:hypothetical protein